VVVFYQGIWMFLPYPVSFGDALAGEKNIMTRCCWPLSRNYNIFVDCCVEEELKNTGKLVKSKKVV